MSDAPDTAPTPVEQRRALLDAKRLAYQHCAACGNAWLPAREDCPRCWSRDWEWRDASGEATVVSWVVYHVGFDPRFKDRVPYNVAVVELAEGPRMVTNLIDPPEGDPIGRAARVEFQHDLGRWLPRFRLTE